jgi:hypothetical protein
MNSIHRVGLTIAGAVTVLTVGGALVVDGYLGARSAAAQATASAQAPTQAPTATPTPTPVPTLEPLTIYVKPVPTPAIVKITKTIPAPPAVQPPPPVKPTTPPPATPHATPAPTYQDDNGGGDN